MNPDAPVILDTCNLVPMSLCDTLLRPAECEFMFLAGPANPAWNWSVCW